MLFENTLCTVKVNAIGYGLQVDQTLRPGFMHADRGWPADL